MTAGLNFSGFSGVDTAGLLEALMAVENQRLTRVQAQRTSAVSKQTAWNTVSTAMSALSTQAASLASSSRLVSNTVTSSAPSVVSVSGTAPTGSISFTVDTLAASSLHSISGLASPEGTVGAGTLNVSRGLSSLGIQGVSGVAIGESELSVLDSGAAASRSAAFASSVTLNSSASLTFASSSPSGSTSTTVTVPSGTYTHAQLATTLAGLLSGSGFSASVVGGLATVTSTTGVGSAHTLTVSGSGASRLSMQGSSTGSDAVVSIGGVETVLTAVSAGGTVSASTGTGTASITLSAGQLLSEGTGTVSSHTFSAASSVSDVAATINAASSDWPVSAAVLGGTGTTQIILTGKETGAANDLEVSWTGFTAGSVSRLRSAADAELSIGSQTVTRSSNVVSDLVPGASLTLLAKSNGSEVTITGALDSAAMAAKVTGFVNSVNDTLSTLDTLMRVTPGNSGANGALAGDSTARSLRRSLVSSLSQTVGSGNYSSLASVGVTMGRDGKFAVNQGELSKAIAADAAGVARLFSQSAEATASDVSFVAAASTATQGTYAASITTAAERASVQGGVFSSLASSEVLSVAFGSASVSVALPSGSTPTSVAAALNSSFSSEGLRVFAEVTSDSRVRISSEDYGSSVSLSVTSSGSGVGLASASDTGVDVAGLIDGAAATGSGRILSGASAATSGISLESRVLASDVAAAGGSLGFSFTYTSGLSGVIRTAVDSARSTGGSISTASTSAASALTRADSEIARVTRALEMTESRLRKQFAALETALSRIKGSTPNFSAIPVPGNSNG